VNAKRSLFHVAVESGGLKHTTVMCILIPSKPVAQNRRGDDLIPSSHFSVHPFPFQSPGADVSVWT